MENKIFTNALLDFYGELLTENQRRICRYYYEEDLSLQEIAELENISRSAVYDTIKRCRHELNHYEEVLHLYENWKKRNALYQKIKAAGNEEVNRLIDACIETEME